MMVSHLVALKRSLMNSSATPPFTPMEDAWKVLRAVGKDIVEVVVLVLEEAVDAGFDIVLRQALVENALKAHIVRVQIDVGADRIIVGAAFIVRCVVVIEGREREQRAWDRRCEPRKR